MIAVVKCRQCGKSSAVFGETTATVTFSTSFRPCAACGHGDRLEKSLWFCSVECLTAWATDRKARMELESGTSE